MLFDLPLADVADGPGWRIRWSELYRVLREAAGASVHYGCEITSIGRDAADPRKTSVAWTQDGKTFQLDGIDLLIAADGRYSGARRVISGEPRIKQTGVAISRVLVPDTSNGLIDDYEQWFNGPNRLLSFRVPPDHIYIAGAFPIPPEAEIAPEQKMPDALARGLHAAIGAAERAGALADRHHLCRMSPIPIGRACRSTSCSIAPAIAMCSIWATPPTAWCRHSGRARRRRSKMPRTRRR